SLLGTGATSSSQFHVWSPLKIPLPGRGEGFSLQGWVFPFATTHPCTPGGVKKFARRGRASNQLVTRCGSLEAARPRAVLSGNLEFFHSSPPPEGNFIGRGAPNGMKWLFGNPPEVPLMQKGDMFIAIP